MSSPSYLFLFSKKKFGTHSGGNVLLPPETDLRTGSFLRPGSNLPFFTRRKWSVSPEERLIIVPPKAGRQAGERPKGPRQRRGRDQVRVEVIAPAVCRRERKG